MLQHESSQLILVHSQCCGEKTEIRKESSEISAKQLVSLNHVQSLFMWEGHLLQRAPELAEEVETGQAAPGQSQGELLHEGWIDDIYEGQRTAFAAELLNTSMTKALV